MRKAFIQPIGDGYTRGHYRKTIIGKIPLSFFSKFVHPGQSDILKTIYPNHEAIVWGIQPSPKNESAWSQLSKNDYVLFYFNKEIIGIGIIGYRFQNQPLADALWETFDNEQSWELLYFMTSYTFTNIPIETIAQACRYKNSFIGRGFGQIGLTRELNGIISKAINY